MNKTDKVLIVVMLMAETAVAIAIIRVLVDIFTGG